MVKLKPLLFLILFTFLLFPLSNAFAQEDTTVDDDVVLYDTTVDEDVMLYDTATEEEVTDSKIEPRIYESQIAEMQNELDDVISPQQSKAGLAVALASMGVLVIFPILIGLATYIFTSLALAKIGKELGYKNSWFAWIPLLNTIMLMQLGEKSAWWILVPFVGQIMMIVAIMRITERRGYDKLLGLIFLTGIGAYVLLYLLAWSPKTVASAPVAPVVSTNNIPTQPSLEEQIQQEAKATIPQQPEQTVEAVPTQPQQPTTPTL